MKMLESFVFFQVNAKFVYVAYNEVLINFQLNQEEIKKNSESCLFAQIF